MTSICYINTRLKDCYSCIFYDKPVSIYFFVRNEHAKRRFAVLIAKLQRFSFFVFSTYNQENSFGLISLWPWHKDIIFSITLTFCNFQFIFIYIWRKSFDTSYLIKWSSKIANSFVTIYISGFLNMRILFLFVPKHSFLFFVSYIIKHERIAKPQYDALIYMISLMLNEYHFHILLCLSFVAKKARFYSRYRIEIIIERY